MMCSVRWSGDCQTPAGLTIRITNGKNPFAFGFVGFFFLNFETSIMHNAVLCKSCQPVVRDLLSWFVSSSAYRSTRSSYHAKRPFGSNLVLSERMILNLVLIAYWSGVVMGVAKTYLTLS
jgi:hypothetical protein